MKRICAQCGRSYETSRKKSTFCSRECYRESLQAERRCTRCGAIFTARRRQTVCEACREPQGPIFDLKLPRSVPPLQELSGEELLHYGRTSAAYYLQSERLWREKQAQQPKHGRWWAAPRELWR